MAVDIGPKIGIDGEAQFRREINEINQSLKTMAAEQKAVASAFDDEADAEKKAAAQKESLAKQIDAQKKKLELLEKGLRESAAMYDETDVRTQKWQQAVHEATATLNGMEAELRDVDRGLDGTAESMQDAEKAAGGWADVMKGQLLADAIKGGLSMMADLIKGAASALWDASKAGAAYADDILTMASTTGLSTQKLQEYKYMADLVDVSVETITGSMTKMEKKLISAKDGTGAAAEAWKTLGVKLTDANGQLRSSEEIFNDTIDALGKIENETERDAIAMQLMGTSAKDLNPLIEAGADRLEELAQAAHDTGYVLDNEALTALGKQQDAMDTLDKKVEAVKNQFAVGLAPGITTAFETINDTLDNPRTQRAISVLSEGIGGFIQGLADLAADVLPEIVNAFGIFDSRLATYSDDQLRRLQEMETMQSSWDGMKATFEDDAAAIWDEHKNIEALYKKLQDLTDENGNVTESNREMADFIVNELNEKLGLNIQMIDGVIQGWQDVQTQIEETMTKQTALALLAAGTEKYAAALAEQNEAGRLAAAALRDLRASEEELAQKEAEHAATLADIEDKYGDVAEAPLKVRLAYKKEGDAITELRGTVANLTEDYEKQQNHVDDLMATTETYSKALRASTEGDYQATVDYMTKGISVERDYLADKVEIDQQKLAELQQAYQDQADYIDLYEAGLKEKKAGYNKEGLEAEKKYLAEIGEAIRQARRDMLNDQASLMKEEGLKDGSAYGDGIIAGLNNKTGPVYNAAMGLAGSITRATRNTLQISSPSRVGAWIGEMWDKGLIKGITDYEAQLERAAAGLATTISDASAPSSDMVYGNAMTAAGIGYGSNAYTTNMGGITVQIEGAGEVDADLLAQRVAVRLTDVLMRAQRGGRA